MPKVSLYNTFLGGLRHISTVKFTKAGYVTVFDHDEVNIYDQCNIVITVSWAVILCGWRKPGTNALWHIPLVPVICNNNVDTVLVKCPPSKYLPKRPPPSEAIHIVYELKMQPELVQTTTRQLVSPQSPPGIRPSRMDNLCCGPASPQPQLQSISLSPRRPSKALHTKPVAASDPQSRSRPTALTTTMMTRSQL